MHITTTIEDVKNYLLSIKKQGKTVGFVPTMGALHQGHLSLLELANKQNDAAVASIFVNPLQFNDKKDLERYPRKVEKDIQMLGSAHCNVLFMPTVEEMYPASLHLPSEEEQLHFDLGNLDKVMEGIQRPGHFRGVCVVVKKLFDIIQPDRAYFGEKDFQQLSIIKHMVKELKIPVEIISCPTIREADGLAMSSRNALLSTQERKNAALIFKILSEVKERKNHTFIPDLKKWVKEKINENPFLQLEYFEIVDPKTLLPVSAREEAQSLRACIAVKVGAVRLIDNMPV